MSSNLHLQNSLQVSHIITKFNQVTLFAEFS